MSLSKTRFVQVGAARTRLRLVQNHPHSFRSGGPVSARPTEVDAAARWDVRMLNAVLAGRRGDLVPTEVEVSRVVHARARRVADGLKNGGENFDTDYCALGEIYETLLSPPTHRSWIQSHVEGLRSSLFKRFPAQTVLDASKRLLDHAATKGNLNTRGRFEQRKVPSGMRLPSYMEFIKDEQEKAATAELLTKVRRVAQRVVHHLSDRFGEEDGAWLRERILEGLSVLMSYAWQANGWKPEQVLHFFDNAYHWWLMRLDHRLYLDETKQGISLRPRRYPADFENLSHTIALHPKNQREFSARFSDWRRGDATAIGISRDFEGALFFASEIIAFRMRKDFAVAMQTHLDAFVTRLLSEDCDLEKFCTDLWLKYKDEIQDKVPSFSMSRETVFAYLRWRVEEMQNSAQRERALAHLNSVSPYAWLELPLQ